MKDLARESKKIIMGDHLLHTYSVCFFIARKAVW